MPGSFFLLLASAYISLSLSLFSFCCEWKRGLFGCDTTFCFIRGQVTLIPRATVARCERCNNNILNVISLLIIVQQSNFRRHGNRRERTFASRIEINTCKYEVSRSWQWLSWWLIIVCGFFVKIYFVGRIGGEKNLCKVFIFLHLYFSIIECIELCRIYNARQYLK